MGAFQDPYPRRQHSGVNILNSAMFSHASPKQRTQKLECGRAWGCQPEYRAPRCKEAPFGHVDFVEAHLRGRLPTGSRHGLSFLSALQPRPAACCLSCFEGSLKGALQLAQICRMKDLVNLPMPHLPLEVWVCEARPGLDRRRIEEAFPPWRRGSWWRCTTWKAQSGHDLQRMQRTDWQGWRGLNCRRGKPCRTVSTLTILKTTSRTM